MKHAGGRPKSVDPTLTRTRSVRFTPEEDALVEAAADRDEMAPSTWIREQALTAARLGAQTQKSPARPLDTEFGHGAAENRQSCHS
ncbi:hypothetical protein N1027_10635 [Herbiconiux sp. CPCC 205763]|uniref:Transposase n=1 Tax=Herbiconiux aconitum TaxID=2970913 RepID=A0ABT2GQU9_9MICO|nr:hypothetical protein [Herbiconiux aconitum]MCS5718589.1 hypothetical protein [Herbiconiux aconitum]